MILESEIGHLPQGDPRLLTHPLAQQLLASTELARLAYIGPEGAPRVVPVGFVWNGAELVVSTFRQSPKVRALRLRPEVAVSIDRPGPPPEVLTIRGSVVLDDVDGVPVEYRQMQERYYGAAQADAIVGELERTGATMTRIGLRPGWVGVLDFQTRFPGAVAAALSAGD